MQAPCVTEKVARAGGTAFFGPLEYQPEDWADLCSLTDLKICQSPSRITAEHLNAIFQLRALRNLELGQTINAHDENDSLDLAPVRLEYLHTLELGCFAFCADLVLECPCLHTLRLVDSALRGHVRLAGCPQLRTLDFTYCPLVAEWPGPELLHVQGLTALCMNSCMLDNIPIDILSMSALKHLLLADNSIGEVPTMLLVSGVLGHLSACCFAVVPQIPDTLTTLTRLDLGRQSADLSAHSHAAAGCCSTTQGWGCWPPSAAANGGLSSRSNF